MLGSLSISLFILCSITIEPTMQRNVETVITEHRLNKNQTVHLIKETSLGVDRITTCKAKLDDGRIIDLTSLDNAGSPRYFNNDDDR